MTGRCVVERASLAFPLREATIEDDDVVMSHHAKHPPDPCGAEQAGAVINDNAIAVAKSKCADARRELFRCGQHVRIRAFEIADFIDIEKHGAWNVFALVLGARIALRLRQIPGGIDDPDIRCGEMGGEPVGRHERRGGDRHSSTPCVPARLFF